LSESLCFKLAVWCKAHATIPEYSEGKIQETHYSFRKSCSFSRALPRKRWRFQIMKPKPKKGARMLKIAIARNRSKNRSVITVAGMAGPFS